MAKTEDGQCIQLYVYLHADPVPFTRGMFLRVCVIDDLLPPFFVRSAGSLFELERKFSSACGSLNQGDIFDEASDVVSSAALVLFIRSAEALTLWLGTAITRIHQIQSMR